MDAKEAKLLSNKARPGAIDRLTKEVLHEVKILADLGGDFLRTSVLKNAPERVRNATIDNLSGLGFEVSVFGDGDHKVSWEK